LEGDAGGADCTMFEKSELRLVRSRAMLCVFENQFDDQFTYSAEFHRVCETHNKQSKTRSVGRCVRKRVRVCSCVFVVDEQITQ